ncbi:MAG: Asp-tRNA(Asn)/Glu-tRNA(Gln) amidotransferase subunit GatA [Anaerolineaceae bacterium]|nr:Asp-tRNA(Asn)/Glu-tRNA(Gln) amidotransferase subunit GatA [Anaerolineaceae bacterium]
MALLYSAGATFGVRRVAEIDVLSSTIEQIGKDLRAGKYTAQALTAFYLDRIHALNDELQCFVHIDEGRAMRQAAAADERLAAGETGALLGIPIANKDNISRAGALTTAGSRILGGYTAPYSATVIERLEAAGAIILGTTNMDEFGMGSSNENSAYGPVLNPWSKDRVPGGSSGGSAAAVCAGLCAAALGSDTGGSLRQPAAYTGLVALKPSYGRVSRWGLVAFGSSLEQIGPLARSAADAAHLLQVMAGPDPRDANCAHAVVPDYVAELEQADLRGTKIGIAEEYFVEDIEAEVKAAVEAAIELLSQLGAAIYPVSLPSTQYALPTYYLIASSEASANLARYDGIRYGQRETGKSLGEVYQNTRTRGFGSEVKRRIMLGTYALSAGYYDAFYGKASQVRDLIQAEFEQVFQTVDLLVTPTAPTTAFRLGEKLADPLQMYLADAFVLPANLAGICGISIPCGFDLAGLPIGLQLLAPAFAEANLLQAAHRYQQETDWHLRRPTAIEKD